DVVEDRQRVVGAQDQGSIGDGGGAGVGRGSVEGDGAGRGLEQPGGAGEVDVDVAGLNFDAGSEQCPAAAGVEVAAGEENRPGGGRLRADVQCSAVHRDGAVG